MTKNKSKWGEPIGQLENEETHVTSVWYKDGTYTIVRAVHGQTYVLATLRDGKMFDE